MTGHSLGRRFFVRSAILLLVALAAVTALEYLIARREVYLLYDKQLATSATMLYDLMAEELAGTSTESGASPKTLLSDEDRQAFTAFAPDSIYRVWRNGVLVNSSDKGPPFKQAELSDGFETTSLDGGWRIYTQTLDKNGVTVSVGERLSLRNDLILSIVTDLVAPGALLVSGLLVAAWLMANSSLRTLRRLVWQLGRRSYADLAPIAGTNWPAELLPMIDEMNKLFARVAAGIDQERSITNLAAHQLRTPLASLLLQCQLASQTADSTERKNVLERMQRTIKVATGQIAGLLALVRLDQTADATDHCDWQKELEAAIADLLPAATAQARSIDVETVPDAMVRLDPASARLICACILDNAIKFSPAKSTIQVRLTRDGGAAVLSVSDEGPGIPARERDRVFLRFYRGTGSELVTGSGLGLSIVAAATARGGGEVKLSDGEGTRGLKVTVRLPLAATDATLHARKHVLHPALHEQPGAVSG